MLDFMGDRVKPFGSVFMIRAEFGKHDSIFGGVCSMKLSNDSCDLLESLGRVCWGIVELLEKDVDFGRVDVVL